MPRLTEEQKADLALMYSELTRVLSDSLYPYQHLSNDVLEIFQIGFNNLIIREKVHYSTRILRSIKGDKVTCN